MTRGSLDWPPAINKVKINDNERRSKIYTDHLCYRKSSAGYMKEAVSVPLIKTIGQQKYSVNLNSRILVSLLYPAFLDERSARR